MLTLKSTYDALKADYETLQSEKQKLEAKIVDLSKETITAEAFNAVKTELETATSNILNLTDLNASLSAKVTELEANKKTLEEMAADKALEIVSSQGVPPVSMKPNAQPSSNVDNDVVSQYNAITNPMEASKYWAEHKEELSTFVRNHKR